MCEEKKIPQEIENEDDLDQVAGGAYVDGDPLNYRCGFCGQRFVFYSRAEMKTHVIGCPKNPNNY